MNNPHFLEVDDLTQDELFRIIERASELKQNPRSYELDQLTLTMLFETPSLRTRVSFETSMTQLGGHAVYLGADDIQLGRGEPIRDTSRTLARYADAILARLFDHNDLEILASYSDVPVLNGLTDLAHPCQALADLLTIKEEFGSFEDVEVTWVGDGNNVARSFVLACALVGIDLIVATPEGYGISDQVLNRTKEIGNPPKQINDPDVAVTDADLVYTDVWVSMGQEARRFEKIDDFEGYQVNADLLRGSDAKIMHCLPAHRGEEITNDILEGEHSIVWKQAENRLHAQKSLLLEILR